MAQRKKQVHCDLTGHMTCCWGLTAAGKRVGGDKGKAAPVVFFDIVHGDGSATGKKLFVNQVENLFSCQFVIGVF